MTNRIELAWDLDGFVQEQRYYCSLTTIDINSPPNPKVILGAEVRSYTDLDVTLEQVLHVRVSSIKNGTEKFSDEIVVNIGETLFVDLSVEAGVLINRGETMWANYRGVQFIDDYMLFNAATSSDNTSYLQSHDLFNWSSDWEIEAEIMRATTTSATGTIFSNNNTTGSKQSGSCWIYTGSTSGSTSTVRNKFHIGGEVSGYGTTDIPVGSYHKVKMKKQGLVISSFINDVLTNSFNITAAQQAALNVDHGPMNIGNNIINQQSGQFVGRIKSLKVRKL